MLFNELSSDSDSDRSAGRHASANIVPALFECFWGGDHKVINYFLSFSAVSGRVARLPGPPCRNVLCCKQEGWPDPCLRVLWEPAVTPPRRYMDGLGRSPSFIKHAVAPGPN